MFFYQFVNHVESYVVKLPFAFSFLICGILNTQKNDILTSYDKISVASSVLNFSYKLFVQKHVNNIEIPIIVLVDETSMGFDEETLDVSPLSGPVRNSYSQGLDS